MSMRPDLYHAQMTPDERRKEVAAIFAMGILRPVARVVQFSPRIVSSRSPPRGSVAVPRRSPAQRPNGARWIDVSPISLPGSLVCLIGLLLPKLFSVLVAIGNKSHD